MRAVPYRDQRFATKHRNTKRIHVLSWRAIPLYSYGRRSVNYIAFANRTVK